MFISKFVDLNMKEIGCLMMNSEKYYSEIAHIVDEMAFKKAKELYINFTDQKTTKIEKLEKKLEKEESI